MVDVYVAAAPIAFGTVIAETLVTTQSWPRDAVPHEAFVDPELLFPEGEGARIAKGNFVAGEILIAPKLSRFGEDITAVVPQSKDRRAMAVRARGEALTGGLVSAGDFIDVVFAEGEGRNMRAVTLLQGVRVLGVGVSGLITLEVSPLDAQNLALAQEAGVLVVSLQMGADPTEVALEAIDLHVLLKEEAPKPVPSAAAARVVPVAPKPTVLVRRGNETSVESVQRSGN